MEVAGASDTLQRSFTDHLDLLQRELQQTVLRLLQTRDLRALRLVSKHLRALVSKYLYSITLTSLDLDKDYWLLHTRFPAVRILAISDSGDNSLQDARFADFAISQLRLLTSLVKLDLSKCKALSTASIVAVAFCCPQLESFNLPHSGELVSCQPV